MYNIQVFSLSLEKFFTFPIQRSLVLNTTSRVEIFTFAIQNSHIINQTFSFDNDISQIHKFSVLQINVKLLKSIFDTHNFHIITHLSLLKDFISQIPKFPVVEIGFRVLGSTFTTQSLQTTIPSDSTPNEIISQSHKLNILPANILPISFLVVSI
jgi:hypothetical protein